MASRRESIPAVVGVAGMLTTSRARSARAAKATMAERRACCSSAWTWRWLERATACQP
jgi:hypothetical protein